MHGNESSTKIPLVAIVDDDASMRNSTRRLIRLFGFRAEAFASAREFLDSGCPTETACLILDVRMRDGLELQRLLGQHLNTGFHQNRIGHRGAVSLPPQHQPVAGWTAAKLRWRSAAATEADRHEVIFSSFLNVQDSNIPLPQMQGVADVKELFLSAQFEFVQGFR
jgi:CheY-like chemotaxis protein